MKAALLSLFIAFCAIHAGAESITTLPIHTEGFSQTLNGAWSFKYLPSLNPGPDANFTDPATNVSAWKKIHVPGNWELQGFAEPHYDLDLQDGLGLYRRTFRIPANWSKDGRRVCLRFEAVAYGFQAWVNGTMIGASAASAYNPSTFDITDALKKSANAYNILAVQVTTKPFAYEFDVNDDWSLGGICRDVTLFSIPATHFQDLTTHTHLGEDGAADLSISVTTNQQEGEVHGTLLDPAGTVVKHLTVPPGKGNRRETVVDIPHAHLWTAETPALYRLQLTLDVNGKPVQTLDQRIGLREITIANGVLLLNGRPFKLHGVDHHDLDPIDGRAITEPEMRRDLALMKKGNINFIRTSHYAPQPRFIELCDELGFYVLCEVAIGKGEAHDNDPAYRANIMARTEATITRDKNHPSVIVWSIGNENPITDLLLDAGRHAKELDPWRPICYPTIGSYFEKNYQRFPDFVDIYSPHYPVNSTLRRYAQQLTRPLILTEYAHAWGLAADRIQDQWEILQKTPRFAGGAIWHFMDQGLLRTSSTANDRTQPAQYVWLDPHHYYDTHNGDGTDGIVYSDRTPQFDFWETRKVYSPVQITQNSAPVKPGRNDISLSIENRYDFRSLAGINLAWSLQRNQAELATGSIPLNAAPHSMQTVQIPVTIPTGATRDILSLNLRCADTRSHLQITERTIRLDLPGADRRAWLAALAPTIPRHTTSSQGEVNIARSQWTLTVSSTTGELMIRDHAGQVLVAGIYPHTGRKLTMADKIAAKKANTWSSSTLVKLDAPLIKTTEGGGAVHITVSGTYPRPDAPEQSFVGGYQVTVATNDATTITYDFVPTNAKGLLTEAGLSLVLPAALTEFRWIGQGIYPAYPGKDRLDEFGIFHLNREDLRFQGNRRETEVALMTTAAGAGIALVTDSPSDIAVQRDGNTTLLSHNAVISGLGNKGTQPETTVDSAKTPHISGSFTLLPLGATWPAPLQNWFGKPGPATDIFHPFYNSYDQ